VPLLQVRISLDDIEPAIWRLVDIDGSRPLAEVHDAVQIAMGWTDSHLHAFEHPDGRRWSDPGFDLETDEEDETTMMLAEAVDADWLRYEYDFGDSWSHRLEVVGRADGEQAAVVVRDGARSAPPEDCGGVPGYDELLETLADPTAEDHDAMTAWASRSRWPWQEEAPFDPEAFDLDAVNRRLRQRFEPETAIAVWGSSLQQLVEGLTPGARTAFGDHLGRARLEDPVDLDAARAAACVRPFAWLLDRVADEGVRLTSAGRLPPAVVREASDALGWGARWIGTMNREDHVPPAAHLREWATRTTLVRKYKGRLLLTRAGTAARRDPMVLLRHLAERLPRLASKGAGQEACVLLLADLAAGVEPARDELAARVAVGLHLLGYAAQDRWSPPSASGAFGLVSEVWGLLGMLGLVEDHFRDQVPGSRDVVREMARLALQEG